MSRKYTTILGIESSCDDTSAAILCGNKIMANCVATQQIHQKYGGVVPELASRAHQEQIVPIIKEALSDAQIELKDIDAIAFTRGPGLMGSLVVGVSFAKALSLAIKKPLIDVNHMKAHVLAHFIETEGTEPPGFPFLCLTVSGGHTQIVEVQSSDIMTVIGKTIDDAAGEAFDKAAKMIGIDYPGGPELDKIAEEGNPEKFSFAKPRIKDLDFSFSGLKTSILYKIRDLSKQDSDFAQKNKADLCASIRKSIVDILIEKLLKASKDKGIKTLAIAGGVSANRELRRRLRMLEKEGYEVYIPKFEYCTDNAAMVAIAGKFAFERGEFAAQNVSADPRLKW
ncbi:MAG: tRNA (adenosine(37)-N6)-threonylcarbamoyltransferase complex transferase subunit TsaD [Crocinitomicaceae bacterium]|nr:tRNA (adenosine(37)-N6)-threonylcarbamoyltransferase complex transferase subunit TsaD [Crocinitomicaceae bacterium]